MFSAVHPTYKFLIVDDEEDSRFLVRHFLLKAFPEADVTECTSLEMAIETVRQASFDGIITDHHLKSPDVMGVIREARKRDTDCPIVMMTASSDPQVCRRAYEAGASHVFTDGNFNFTGYLRSTL